MGDGTSFLTPPPIMHCRGAQLPSGFIRALLVVFVKWKNFTLPHSRYVTCFKVQPPSLAALYGCLLHGRSWHFIKVCHPLGWKRIVVQSLDSQCNSPFTPKWRVTVVASRPFSSSIKQGPETPNDKLLCCDVKQLLLAYITFHSSPLPAASFPICRTQVVSEITKITGWFHWHGFAGTECSLKKMKTKALFSWLFIIEERKKNKQVLAWKRWQFSNEEAKYEVAIKMWLHRVWTLRKVYRTVGIGFL